jgi:hypothetical protein
MRNDLENKDRYFVLRANNKIEEYNSILEALKVNDEKVVIIDKFKKYITPQNGYDWKVSEFIFINNENLPYLLTSNSWKIHAIDTIYKSSSTIKFIVTFSDPLNRIGRKEYEHIESRKSDYYSNDIILVKLSIEKLHEYSKFQNWEQLNLENENLKLKSEIIKLKNKIIELNQINKI